MSTESSWNSGINTPCCLVSSSPEIPVSASHGHYYSFKNSTFPGTWGACIFLWAAHKTCLELGKRMMTYYKFSHNCLHGPPNIFRKPWAFGHYLLISGEKLKKNVSLDLCARTTSLSRVQVYVRVSVCRCWHWGVCA